MNERRSADRITLGSSCQVQFWQPVPVSTSARLDIVSGHRFAVPVQAAILMADTLVIGPQAQSHIQVPDMTQPLILFRNKSGLAARWPGEMQVGGRTCRGAKADHGTRGRSAHDGTGRRGNGGSSGSQADYRTRGCR